MQLRRAMTGAGSVMLAAIALAACSSSPASSSGPHHDSSTSTSSSSTTRIASASSTTSSVTTTSTTQPAVCAHRDLALETGSTEGGAGTIYIGFTLTNIGSSPCTLNGYPSIELVAADGDLKPEVDHYGQSQIFSVPPALVTLSPKRESAAGFIIAYSDVPSNGQESCPEVTGIKMGMPGSASQPFDVTRAFTPCGAPTISVSPLVSAAAYKAGLAG